MRKSKVKKENPPARLLGTMSLLVLVLVLVFAALALGIYTLVEQLVRLNDKDYTLLWPILILVVSAILGVVLAIVIFRLYLEPLSRLMQATRAVAAGDYSVRVELRKCRGSKRSVRKKHVRRRIFSVFSDGRGGGCRWRGCLSPPPSIMAKRDAGDAGTGCQRRLLMASLSAS